MTHVSHLYFDRILRMASYQSTLIKTLQEENQRLKLEVQALKQERDAAQNMCRLMQRHYCEVGATMLTPLSAGGVPDGSSTDTSKPVSSSPEFPLEERHKSSAVANSLSHAECSDTVTVPSLERHTVPARDGRKRHLSPPMLSHVEQASHRNLSTSLSVVEQKNKDPTITRNITQQHHFDGRESRARFSGWLEFCPRSNTDAIILSDSVMRCVEKRSFGKDVDLWACSGLRSNEMVEILYKWYSFGVTTKTLVICVGANDYYRSPLTQQANRSWTDIFRYDLEKIFRLAGQIAENVIITNCYHSRWNRPSSGNSRQSFQHLDNWNQLINKLAKKHHATVFDLASMFEDHEGAEGQKGCEWYQKDSLHPNSRGTVAIETCLNHLLNGKQVEVPSDDHPCFLFNEKEEIEKRRSIMQYNYNRFGKNVKQPVAKKQRKY